MSLIFPSCSLDDSMCLFFSLNGKHHAFLDIINIVDVVSTELKLPLIYHGCINL